MAPAGTLGWAIRRARQAAGLNQADLGRALGGVHKDTVSGWERNDARPDGPRAAALAAFFEGKDHGAEVTAALAAAPRDRRSTAGATTSGRSSGAGPGGPDVTAKGQWEPIARGSQTGPTSLPTVGCDDPGRTLADSGLEEVPGMVSREVARALVETIRAEGGELERTREGLRFLAACLEDLGDRLDEAHYPHREIYVAARRLRARAEAL